MLFVLVGAFWKRTTRIVGNGAKSTKSARVKDERGYVPFFFDELVDVDSSVNWCEAHSDSYE